jgi:hypothetical protein
MLFAAPSTWMPSRDLIAIPPVIRRSLGPRIAVARALELGHRLMLAGPGVLRRVGDRGLRPEEQARLVARRAGKGREAPRRFGIEAGPPLVLLADVGLNDPNSPDGQRVGRNRRGRKQPDERGHSEDQDQREPFLVIFEPDHSAEQVHERRQAVGSD